MLGVTWLSRPSTRIAANDTARCHSLHILVKGAAHRYIGKVCPLGCSLNTAELDRILAIWPLVTLARGAEVGSVVGDHTAHLGPHTGTRRILPFGRQPLYMVECAARRYVGECVGWGQLLVPAECEHYHFGDLASCGVVVGAEVPSA